MVAEKFHGVFDEETIVFSELHASPSALVGEDTRPVVEKIGGGIGKGRDSGTEKSGDRAEILPSPGKSPAQTLRDCKKPAAEII